MSHDITDLQGLLAALGMKAVPQHRMWPPCTSLASSLTLLQFPWNPGHPKNYFHFLKWAVTSALGFWTWPSPCREHSFPTSPNLSSSVKSQPGNHFFQEGCFCHYHSSRHTHTPQSLGHVPPYNPPNTAVSQDLAVSPDSLHALGGQAPSPLCSLTHSHAAWHITVSQ